MHKSALAFAAVALVALAGCSAATEAEPPAVDETSAELTLIGDITSPSVTTRRLVRKEVAGCSTVYGDGGKWTGEVVVGPYQSSVLFCAYAWTPDSKAEADLAKLDEIAKYDTQLGRPFNVPDPRSSNEDAVKVTMTKYTPLVSPFSSDLPITNPSDPTPRASGCDVCLLTDSLYLWVVLPPEAYDKTVWAEANGVKYALGQGSDVAIFAKKITGFSGTPVLRWSKD